MPATCRSKWTPRASPTLARAPPNRQRYWQFGYRVVKLGLSRRTAAQVERPFYNVRKEQPNEGSRTPACTWP